MASFGAGLGLAPGSFVWQTSTVTSSGRRGTRWHRRLLCLGACWYWRSLCVARVTIVTAMALVALGRIWRCGTLSGSWLFDLLFFATRFDAKRDCRALTRQAFQIPDKIVTCHVKTVSRPNVLALVDMSVTRYVLPITLSSLMEVPFWRFSW